MPLMPEPHQAPLVACLGELLTWKADPAEELGAAALRALAAAHCFQGRLCQKQPLFARQGCALSIADVTGRPQGTTHSSFA